MAGHTLWKWIALCICSILISSALPQGVAHSASQTAPQSFTCYGKVDIRQAGSAAAPHSTYHGHVEVRLFDGNDRIQLPQGFRPAENPRDDGWYKVKNLKASDDDIIGNAIISFIDKPFFRVDLLSGRIDVTGLGGTFVGECRKTGF